MKMFLALVFAGVGFWHLYKGDEATAWFALSVAFVAHSEVDRLRRDFNDRRGGWGSQEK